MSDSEYEGCPGDPFGMREIIVPFKFDLREIVGRLKSIATVDGLAISLPGLQIKVKIDDIERKVAREVVIKAADRRILNSRECCDSCITSALESLQKIRELFVDKQVVLAGDTKRPLYLLLEVAAEGVRQFFTYHEGMLRKAKRLQGGEVDQYDQFPSVGFAYRQTYLAALENLRSHMHRTLQQVARIGDIDIPKIPASMRYADDWPEALYKTAG